MISQSESQDMKNMQGVPPGPGRRGGPSKCVCPACGYETVHQRGIPCSSMTCPKCGARMIGKWA